MSAPQPAPESRRVERIGVVVHPTRDISRPFDDLLGWAREHGAGVAQVALPGQTRRVADEAPVEECELLVAIGGDGTTLAAIRSAAPAGRAVLGIACGSLGALTTVDAKEVGGALDRFAAGEWTPRRLSALEVAAGAEGEEDHPVVMRAYNDLVVSRAGEGQVRVAASVDGVLYARFAGDGAIVSTAVGSSAYTLAAGGPLLAPELAAYVLTALPAHGGFRPPLVVSAEQTLELGTSAGHGGARVDVDGQHTDLPAARVRIALVPEAATLVHFPGGEPLLAGLRRRGIISDSPRIVADDQRRGTARAPSATGDQQIA